MREIVMPFLTGACVATALVLGAYCLGPQMVFVPSCDDQVLCHMHTELFTVSLREGV